MGDRGYLVAENGSAKFKVVDTKRRGDIYLHYGKLEQGELVNGMKLVSKPDLRLQMKVRANHSATHLLQASLRKLLGPQVVQRGSLVNEECLRFDFTYHQALTVEQWEAVERLVNQAIWEGLPVTIQHVSLQTAKDSGAMALFGERYGDEVRVVKMGDISMELCGGLHVSNTSDIGGFKIEQESGIAAGVRRVVATTRSVALQGWQLQRKRLFDLGERLAVGQDALLIQVEHLIAQNNALRQQLLDYQQQRLQTLAHELWQQREEVEINGGQKLQLIFADGLRDIGVECLRQLWDHLKSHADAAVFLRLLCNGRQHWLVGVGSELTFCDANRLLQQVMQALHGKGGGKRDMAQGSAPYSADDTLLTVNRAWLRDVLRSEF